MTMAVTPLRRIEILPRRIIDGDVEQREHRREHWFQRFVARHECLGDFLADHLGSVDVLDRKEPPQEIADREKGRRRSV